MSVDQSGRAGPRTLAVPALGRSVRIAAAGPGAPEFCSRFEAAWRGLIDDGHPATGALAPGPVISIDVADTAERTIAQHMASVESQITRAAVAGNIGEGLLFHAAAMTDASGAATLLVGPSGAGKTVAVRHFGRHHGYLTDEIALVRRDGSVLPYPKPLSLVNPSTRTKDQIPPIDLGLSPATAGESTVERIIVLDRRPDAGGKAVASRLQLAESVFALVPHLSSFTAMPGSLASLARLIARVGGAERLHYRSIDDLDPRSSLPTCPPLGRGSVLFTTPKTSPTAEPTTRPHGQSVVRAVPRDAIETPGLLIVAGDDTIRALAGVSRTIWHATASPRSLAELLAAARTEHGAADGDDEVIAAHVEELVADGILRWLT